MLNYVIYYGISFVTEFSPDKVHNLVDWGVVV